MQSDRMEEPETNTEIASQTMFHPDINNSTLEEAKQTQIDFSLHFSTFSFDVASHSSNRWQPANVCVH